MVNTYEIITIANESGLLNLLVQKGIVPITFMDYKSIYDSYMVHRKSKGKMQSYEDCAFDCSVSEKTVRLVVKKMES